MATTIQISSDLQHQLSKRKLTERETYEDVIRDLLEDTTALSEQTKKELALARKEVLEGKVHTLAEVKRKLRL